MPEHDHVQLDRIKQAARELFVECVRRDPEMTVGEVEGVVRLCLLKAQEAEL